MPDMQTATFSLSAIGIVIALVAATLTYFNAKTNPPAEAPERFADSFDPAGTDSFMFIRTDLPNSIYGKEVGNPASIIWEGYSLGVHKHSGALTTFRMIISGHPRGMCHYFWWTENQDGDRLTFQDGGHVQATFVPDHGPYSEIMDLSVIYSIQTINQAINLFSQTAQKLGYTHVRMDKNEDGEVRMFHPNSGMHVISQDRGYKLVPAPVATEPITQRPGVYVTERPVPSERRPFANLIIETPYGDTLDWADVLFIRFPEGVRNIEHHGHPRWNREGIGVHYYENDVTEKIRAQVSQVGYQTAVVDIYPVPGNRTIKIVLAPAEPDLKPIATYTVGAQ